MTIYSLASVINGWENCWVVDGVVLLSPECATYSVTGCACGQDRYREQVHDCPEFQRISHFCGQYLVCTGWFCFTAPCFPHTTSSLSVKGGQEKGYILIRASPQERIAEEFCAAGSVFVWILPGFLKAHVHVLGRGEVCCLPPLDPFMRGATICIRSSQEGGRTLCSDDYLFHSLLGLDETAVLAKPAQCVMIRPQNNFMDSVMMGGVQWET